jgi:hypothetical protein
MKNPKPKTNGGIESSSINIRIRTIARKPFIFNLKIFGMTGCSFPFALKERKTPTDVDAQTYCLVDNSI